MGYGYDLMLEITYPTPLRNFAQKIPMRWTEKLDPT